MAAPVAITCRAGYVQRQPLAVGVLEDLMRVLVMDDEVKVAPLVQRALTEETFAVDVAHDGRTGLDFAMTYAYDLIILDLMLPGVEGAAILRSYGRPKSLRPCWCMTARDAVNDKVQHFELGADDYLTKPFALAELRRGRARLRVRGWVSRSSNPSAPRMART